MKTLFRLLLCRLLRWHSWYQNDIGIGSRPFLWHTCARCGARRGPLPLAEDEFLEEKIARENENWRKAFWDRL